jgi:hypothetical protein
MMHPIYITYERSFNGLIEWKPFGIQWYCHQTIILVWLKMGYSVPVGTPKWMIYHDLSWTSLLTSQCLHTHHFHTHTHTNVPDVPVFP